MAGTGLHTKVLLMSYHARWKRRVGGDDYLILDVWLYLVLQFALFACNHGRRPNARQSPMSVWHVAHVAPVFPTLFLHHADTIVVVVVVVVVVVPHFYPLMTATPCLQLMRSVQRRSTGWWWSQQHQCAAAAGRERHVYLGRHAHLRWHRAHLGRCSCRGRHARRGPGLRPFQATLSETPYFHRLHRVEIEGDEKYLND